MDFKANTPFAYVTLVMMGDAYIPGALIMGYSLARISKMDRVIMVTHDVSIACVNALKNIFTHVVKVPYKKYKSKPFIIKTVAQKERYESWIESSYTKWNLLGMTQYKKVIFLDADVIVTRNIDAVFDFDAPAGVFTNPWAKTYFNRGFRDFYVDLKIGQKIPHNIIDSALKYGGSIVIGTAVLVAPSKKDFNGIFNMLERSQPFGFNTTSGSDEQAITIYYRNQNIKWTMFPPSLNTIGWKLHMLFNQKTIQCDDIATNGREIHICPQSRGGKRRKRKPVTRKPVTRKPIVSKPIVNKNILTKLTKCNLLTCTAPLVIHYFGSEKVWKSDPFGGNAWLDIYVWWQLAYNYICLSGFEPYDIKKLKKIFGIKKNICRDGISMKEECFYCTWLIKEGASYGARFPHLDNSHLIIDKKGNLACPQVIKC